MKQRIQKIAAVVLSLVMTVEMLPLQAFAENTVVTEDGETSQRIVEIENSTVSEVQEETEETTLPVDTVTVEEEEKTDSETITETVEIEQDESEETDDVIQTMSDYPFSGTCGDNLTWEVSDDYSTLTISGTGAMGDFKNEYGSPWLFTRDYIKKIIINKGVTSIGAMAFYNFYNLETVEIPDTVKNIGK
ncbi:MAG: leucine-rich repeat protein [Oscillospiraceae bacterium]|nr:leucine-rich repeat protein [Oscillospiraceae bacterium]